MRFPPAFYQIEREIVSRFPDLRPSKHAWLSLWVFGMFQAKSGTESAVLSALSPYGNLDALRQRLREGLKDGGGRAVPCSATTRQQPGGTRTLAPAPSESPRTGG